MARRTKEDALATRHGLLEAAARVFSEKGVSRTSLHDIATAAGATRGAIYWHFKDKADLFNAMMEQVTLPLEAALCQLDGGDARDPLGPVLHVTLEALRQMLVDEHVRRVFEIAKHKVEYVNEAMPIKARHVLARDGFVALVERSLLAAARTRGLALRVPARTAAHGFHALMDGLVQNWLLSPEEFDLVATAEALMEAYFSGIGLSISLARPTP